MTRRVGPEAQGELQGARHLDVDRAVDFHADVRAVRRTVALIVGWRVTSRADDVVLPLPEPAPPIYAEG
jgi:hypothetical protein